MPSLHFATSVMAAHLLAEAGPVAGALGWTYTATLGFALVYLGEHYVADLLAGAALTEAVRRAAPRAAPALVRLGRAVAALEAAAHDEADRGARASDGAGWTGSEAAARRARPSARRPARAGARYGAEEEMPRVR